MNRQIIFLIILLILAGVILSACDVLLQSFQQTDSQSATLTAMVTPTSVPPTLDLKGNEVLEEITPDSYEVVCISIIEDRIHGGVMEWAEDAPLLAYVAPANRYWGWFSGDAVVLDFAEDAKKPDDFGRIPEGLAPSEVSTTDLHVFGDFAFSPDHSRLAFTALRQRRMSMLRILRSHIRLRLPWLSFMPQKLQWKLQQRLSSCTAVTVTSVNMM